MNAYRPERERRKMELRKEQYEKSQLKTAVRINALYTVHYFKYGKNNGETQEFSAKLDAENGICAAIFVGNTPSAPLFFGSKLNKKITPTEIKDLYEKNYKKNDETGGKPQNEIGRASCRERV